MNFDIIEQKRKARGMTITRLCEKAGVDRKTYYNVKANPDSARFSVVTRLVSAVGLNAVEKAKVLK